MPWSSDKIISLYNKAKSLVLEIYPHLTDIPVFLCSKEELIARICQEFKNQGMKTKTISKYKQFVLIHIVGRYFKESHEIWLVSQEGETLSSLVHELLHSIQICSPHRENIVDYITYKLTNDNSAITLDTLRDWLEIETTYGYGAIVQQLLKDEDCEDF